MEGRFTRSRDDDYVKLNTRRLPLRSGASVVALVGSQQGCNGESTLLTMHDAITFAMRLACGSQRANQHPKQQSLQRG
jgi:hypothetical protein